MSNLKPTAMVDSQSEFTKTGAYNYLKDLLGIPKKNTINKNFFNFFFEEVEKGFYSLKKPADLIQGLFTKEGIVELNNAYYRKKIEHKKTEAKEIEKKIFDIVSNFIAA